MSTRFCHGCNITFRPSGYSKHLSLMTNSHCHSLHASDGSYMLGVDDEEDLDFNDNNLSSSPVHGPSTPHPSPPPCVFEGDYFGMDYTAEDFSWLESSLDDKDYVNKDGYAAEEDDDDDADDDEEGDVDVDGDGDGEEGHNYFHLLAQASLSPAESSLDDSHSLEPQVPC